MLEFYFFIIFVILIVSSNCCINSCQKIRRIQRDLKNKRETSIYTEEEKNIVRENGYPVSLTSFHNKYILHLITIHYLQKKTFILKDIDNIIISYLC